MPRRRPATYSDDTQLAAGSGGWRVQRQDEDLGGLIHHSDRGVQYTSFSFTQCLRDHGIQISNSRKGNPYDNAYVESFFKTLKYEEVYLNEYETFEDAWNNIQAFIEDVYNSK